MMKNNENLTSEKLRLRTKRVVTLLVSLILLFTVAAGATIAYMFLKTGAVTNTFTAATETTPEIKETFIDFTKYQVKVDIGNPGYAVYVRAKVVINWTNASGDVLAVTPPVEGQDYTISYNPDGGWQHCSGHGFWYYTAPINSGETNQLIKECKAISPAPIAGYTLQVDILTQTIQAAGTDTSGKLAVESAWGVTVDPVTKNISK